MHLVKPSSGGILPLDSAGRAAGHRRFSSNDGQEAALSAIASRGGMTPSVVPFFGFSVITQFPKGTGCLLSLLAHLFYPLNLAKTG
jgi:hypothetical protein